MDYSIKYRRRVFDKTTGRCHLCGGGLYFNNFGTMGSKGAWEIEHSIPRSKGGTDHLNNLYPAHINCNRSKSNRSTRSVRAKYGKTRAPYSEKKEAEVRIGNSILGGGTGLMVGSYLRLPNPGLAVFMLLGTTIGYLREVDE